MTHANSYRKTRAAIARIRLKQRRKRGGVAAHATQRVGKTGADMIDSGVDKRGNSLRTLIYQAMRLYETSALFPFLRDRDSVVRAAAVRELRSRDGRTAFDEASKLLNSKKAFEREVAAFLLGQIGIPRRLFPKESVPLVATILKNDKSAAVRATAAASLGHLGDDSAIGPLIDGFKRRSTGSGGICIVKVPAQRCSRCLHSALERRS